MTTRLLVGDAFKRMAELDDHSFDLIVTSPPFLALRSYLPDGHPDKALEIGSEATPADYLDVLLALSAEWRRLLAPHGSIAVELGDTYAGSGGAGGDYLAEGLREGQPKFSGSNVRKAWIVDHDSGRRTPGPGWPLEKSLTGIPTLYAWSLAYGRNLLTGQPSPAGRWRVRNVKPWIRSNPPVGALGDKERPATSYITVACVGASRWFDLDAVRTRPSQDPSTYTGNGYTKGNPEGIRGNESMPGNAGGAPPLDWWHPVDAVIDAVIDQRAGKGANRRTAKGVDSQPRTGKSADRDGNWHDLPELGETNGAVGARGVHIRRALTEAGYLTNSDFYDVSPKGYAGAHYAVWPPELVRLLIDEMCPRRVCTICGEPSRRTHDLNPDYDGRSGSDDHGSSLKGVHHVAYPQTRWTPNGWSDCGCPDKIDGGGLEAPCVPPRATDAETAQSAPPSITHRGRGEQVTSTAGSGPLPTGAGPLGSARSDSSPTSRWRPGRVLDPFSGSGTTLAVASGMGRDSVGIDLDPRNADLTAERVGMFLEVDYGTKEAAS